jgi:predicted RNA-binding Zn-ribbon protein involved in translation (DUF1610 family)
MKTAKKIARSFEIVCPHCGETIPHAGSGSLYWTVDEIEAAGTQLKCPGCEAVSRRPRA